MKRFFLIAAFIFSCTSSGTRHDQPLTYSISLAEITSGVEAPVGVAHAGDGSGRLFVVEQTGKIRVIKDGTLLPEPFLDISSKLDEVSAAYSEKGLLGLAFHPRFKTNGKFYIYYSAPSADKDIDHISVIAEHNVSRNPDVANTNEKILLRIDEPEPNHNGGQLAFGKDGYLYIGVGDGGGAGDKHGTIGNGQDLNSLHGKILRINIDNETGYSVPADNPFVEKDGRDEIWAYGLRNPWRFSFDSKTGLLFCGDVGQDKYEEINLIEKGKNYGWRVMEGQHCYNPANGCVTSGLVLPIDEYDHTAGKCVIGGQVYRGKKQPTMEGKYIFADWTGLFFMLLQPEGQNTWERRPLTVNPGIGQFYINSFGQGEDGEIYVCGQSMIGPHKPGTIYRVDFK